MHILEIFRFNSIYLDFYIAYYVILLMFYLMNDMNEKERDREIERKAKKFIEKTEESACSGTALKFSIDSLCLKFLHLNMHLSLHAT